MRVVKKCGQRWSHGSCWRQSQGESNVTQICVKWLCGDPATRLEERCRKVML